MIAGTLAIDGTSRGTLNDISNVPSVSTGPVLLAVGEFDAEAAEPVQI